MGRRALLRRGLELRVTCPSACRAKAAARQRGRVVARASRRLAGTGALTLRPARLRRGKLSVRVSLRPAQGAPVTFTRGVRVMG